MRREDFSIPEVPQSLLEDFKKEPSNVVLFIGAGISRKVKRPNGEYFPTWVGLLKKMLEWAISRGFTVTSEQLKAFNLLINEKTSKNIIRVGGWLRMLIGESFFQEFMTDIFSIPKEVNSSIHLALSNLPVKGIITFNYDCLIEIFFGSRIKLVATQQNTQKLSDIQRGTNIPFLLKAHGDVNSPNSLVLGYNDYNNIIMNNKAYRKVLSTLFEQNTILILGFGMDDPDLEYLFDDILSSFYISPLSIFALVPKNKFDIITNNFWLRERKVRLLEYIPSSSEHNEVDLFIDVILKELKKDSIISIKKSIVSFSTNLNISTKIKTIRERIFVQYSNIEKTFNLAQDMFLPGQERRLVADKIIANIFLDICEKDHIDENTFSIIARGGYGKGYLCSNSDIDVTFLHKKQDKKVAEKIFKLFSKILIDSWVNLKVLPIINTIDECVSHWQSDFSSLVSFAFSRKIIGNEVLHHKLRKRWNNYVKITDINNIKKIIEKRIFDKTIENELPDLINIKYCAGGMLEVMLISFLKEIFIIKGNQNSDISINNDELHSIFLYYLRFRECLYSINKTCILSKTDLLNVACQMVKGKSPDAFVDDFFLKRKAVRSTLLSLL